MAFDFGLRQIGVAMGSCLLESTRSLPIVLARDGIPDWSAIEHLVKEWQPGLLIVGEPLNMDGTPSELSNRANKFARRIHARLGIKTEMVDERLSSFEAKQLSREQGHRGDYHKQPVDSLAAELILQTWFSEQH